MSTGSEQGDAQKKQKTDFKAHGIPEEFNRHDWKRHSNFTACKKCGLIKGSGFAKCEPVERP